jgi:murein DD-endopeptidase MepM/ murein hydrolase activator NlpD
MRRHCLGIVFCLGLSAIDAGAAEIRIVPADFIVLNPTNPDKNYSDLLVHTIAVATGDKQSATLTSLRVEILSGDQVVLTRLVSIDEMVGGTKYLARAPFAGFINGQVLNDRGIEGLLGHTVGFATSESMEPAQVLLAMRLHFSTGFRADSVRVTAVLAGVAGETVTASVPVRSYASPMKYRAPLEGQWLMQAIPGVQSHHRFNPATEFALDFFKLGADGHILHGGSGEARNYYGFGSAVLAAAQGTVVSVISDQTQDRAAFAHRPGETAADFARRVDAYHMTTMRQNFRAANAGNLVTIRHEKDGSVEFSSYGHLKSGSVRVKAGDRVAQGEPIGEVGDTGDSPAVHLHFQVNAGPDAFTSKSLPALFVNLKAVDGNGEVGQLVTTKPEH